MKKTLSVSVGGYAFILEEEAYRVLGQYLDRVRLNLGTTSDVEEIIADVEGRISEIFKDQLSQGGKEVVDMGMVNHAISTMGAPEDYNINGEPVNEKTSSQQQEQDFSSRHRALFRDPDDRMLGGVCAGISHYLGWDPLAVRLIFIGLLFGFGSGVIVYIILWILVPEAETTAEKLRMHGEPVNLESIKNRFDKFSDEVKDWGRKTKRSKKKWRRAGKQFGHRVEDTVHEMGSVFGKIFGVLMLLGGIVLCIWIFNHFVTGQLAIDNDDHFLSLIAQDPSLVFERKSDYLFLYWGALTLVALIVFGLIKSGIKLLFQIRLKNKFLNTTTTLISILAVCSIVYGGIKLGRQFTKDETVLQTIPLDIKSGSVTIQVAHDPYFSDKLLADDAGFDELLKIKGKRLIFGYPELDIRRCATGGPRIEIEKTAHGPRRMEAIRHAENILYPVNILGDSILFQPVFTAPLADRMRAQQIKVRLYVPDSMVVHVQQGGYRILRVESCDTQESVWHESPYSLRTYIMEPKGMRAIK
jgi:phage shock protein PspC (stress-responsive transcriptional regulator)